MRRRPAEPHRVPTAARPAASLIALALLTGACGRRPASPPPALLALERERHPQAEPQDLYKAAYQACLGPEHDLGDRAAARARIVAELASLAPLPAGSPAPPLLEPLTTPDAPEPIARVNLRALVAHATAAPDGGTAGARKRAIDALLAAMFAARRASDAGRACLARTWGAMVPHLGEAGRALDAQLAARGYPAVHHTASYARAYAPAYRVAPVAALGALTTPR